MKNLIKNLGEKILHNRKIIFLYGIFFGISIIATNLIDTNLFKASIISSNISSYNTSCNGGTFERRFYNGNTTAFFDTFDGSSNYDWGFPNPTITSYNPNGVLSSIPSFNLNSNLKPKGAGDIIVLQSSNTVTINKPNTNITRNDIAAQFNYTVTRIRAPQDQYISKDPNPTYQYKLVSAPDFTVNFQYGEGAHPDFSNGTTYSDTECFNIYVSWCGDGTVDNSGDGSNGGPVNGGETCDDGNNIDGDGCSATCGLEPVNGVCGTANGTFQNEKPIINLCSDGSTPTVSGNGPWTWTCAGSSGGTNESCSANPTPPNTPINGACGDSHLKTLNEKPITDLCTQGIASAVDGTGPWTWTCIGNNGGTDSSCNANLNNSANGSCGSDNGKTLNSTPVNLCSTGTASTVNGIGPWTWTCNGNDDNSTNDDVNCNANKTASISEELNPKGSPTGERWWRALCGNGKIDYEMEQCDDGNNFSGDGCSRRCKIEKVCGDGNVDAINRDGITEQCDDGNNIDGDGCSATCKIDEIIEIKKPIVLQQYCGNGKIEEGEYCDDGNTNNLDFCNNACMFTNIAEKPAFKQSHTSTGPSEILYFLISLILSGGIFYRRKIINFIEK